jgi:hypothetical protein
MCERCCPGFEQKKWQRAREGQENRCERRRPNIAVLGINWFSMQLPRSQRPVRIRSRIGRATPEFGHSRTIRWRRTMPELQGQSVVSFSFTCKQLQHNTEGINCNQCSVGFYRPAGKSWNERDVCQRKLLLPSTLNSLFSVCV